MLYIDILLVLTLVISGCTDVLQKKIYNVLLFPVAILALFLHAALQGTAGALIWLQGLGLGLALLFLPFLMGGMGGGDVKLLGVVGALKGPAFVLKGFLLTALLGGIMALIALIQRRKLAPALKSIAMRCMNLIGFISTRGFYRQSGQPEASGAAGTSASEAEAEPNALPYGVAIALGTMLAYLW